MLADRRAPFILLVILLAPLLGQAAADGPPEADASATASLHEKVSTELREVVAGAGDSPPTQEETRLVSVLPVEGMSGRDLSRALRVDGYRVGAVGLTSVEVRATDVDVTSLAARADIVYVETPVPLARLATTEGLAAARASLAHDLGRTGADVDVAIIDIGFDPTNPEIADNVVTALSFDGFAVHADATAHGTAAAEIIVDLAPSVRLHLLRVSTTTQLEAALDWAVGNGIEVVSISLGVTSGPFDGSSSVSRAVTRASDAGLLVAVSSGNSANHHWRGEWSDPDGNGRQNFAAADETIDVVMRAGDTLAVSLSWNEFPASANDFNLHLLDAAGTVLRKSENRQSGTQPPRESIEYTATGDMRVHLVLARALATSAPMFQLFASHSGPALAEHRVPESSITMPADARGAIAVGAASAGGAHSLHSYSSRGPTDDGRLAPHFTGAAGVSTTAYGPASFYGTSAAAPHVAGLLALLVHARPSLTRDEALPLLAAVSKDLGDVGPDNATGYGWIDAYDALRALDNAPPAVTGIVFDNGNVTGPGPVRVQLAFDDRLGRTDSASIRLVATNGADLPLTVESVGERTLAAAGVVPADFPSGPARLVVGGVEDWAGNPLEIAETNATLLVDAEPPRLELVSPNMTIATTRPQFRIQVEDALTEIDPTSFRITVGNATLDATYGSGTLSFGPTFDLAAGPQTVTVTAADVWGNAATAQWTFTVLAPPRIVLPDATLLASRSQLVAETVEDATNVTHLEAGNAADSETADDVDLRRTANATGGRHNATAEFSPQVNLAEAHAGPSLVQRATRSRARRPRQHAARAPRWLRLRERRPRGPARHRRRARATPRRR